MSGSVNQKSEPTERIHVFCFGMFGGRICFSSPKSICFSKHRTCHTFWKSESWHLLASLSCFVDVTSREKTCTWQRILPSLSLILRTNMLFLPECTNTCSYQQPNRVQRNSTTSHKVEKLSVLYLFIICAYLCYKSAAVTLTRTILLCNQCMPSPASCKRTTWQLACLSQKTISTQFIRNQV